MSSEPYSFAALRNRFTITGTLIAITALRIGAGRDTEVTSNDLPVLRDALNRPFIPGASLKGTLRARLEALIRAVAPRQAYDLQQLEMFMQDVVPELRDRDVEVRRLVDAGKSNEADALYTQKLISRSSLIDLTFGSPWMAGRLFFKDALMQTSANIGLFEVRNGVAINRDTETVDGSKLYDFEVVPAGTRFRFELVMENVEQWQLGMITLGLKPWERGDVQVGGFRSRGLGYMQLVDVERRYTEINSVDNIIALLSNELPSPTTPEYEDTWRVAFRDKLARAASE